MHRLTCAKNAGLVSTGGRSLAHTYTVSRVRILSSVSSAPLEETHSLLRQVRGGQQACHFTGQLGSTRPHHRHAILCNRSSRSFLRPETSLLQLYNNRTYAAMAEPVHSRSAQRLADSMEKPLLDNRSYRVIKLPNDLEALIIHDPDTDKASAAMDVNVGSFSDPEDMPGMAHAVEHLLFMGTEKVCGMGYPVGLSC